MLVPKGEARPKCRWREHEWKFVGYVVIHYWNRTVAMKKHECPICGRFKFTPPTSKWYKR